MLVRIDGLSVPLKVGLQVRLRGKLAITLQNEAEVKEYLESDLQEGRFNLEVEDQERDSVEYVADRALDC
jgi:hypothetical protein